MRGPPALFGLASLFAVSFICLYLSGSPVAYAVFGLTVAGAGWLTWQKAKTAARIGPDRFGNDLPPHVRRALGPKSNE